MPGCVSDDFSAKDVPYGLRIYDDVVPRVIAAVNGFQQLPYFGMVPLLAQGDDADEVVKEHRPMVAQTLTVPCSGVALVLPAHRDKINRQQRR